MPKVIKLEINELPPSINKLYTISSFRSITLTAAGRKFKNKIISEFTQKLLFHIGQLDPNKAHTLEFIFYMPEIENKGWEDGKTKTRFKRQDITNLIKLLEDCLMTVLCIDDSSLVSSSFSKVKGGPKVGITIIELDEDEYIKIGKD